MKYPHTLLLNASFTPLEIINYKRAILLVYKGVAEVVENYPNKFIRSPSTQTPLPSVIRYKRYHPKNTLKSVRCTKGRVYIRDNGKCGYCLKPLTPAQATLDHVKCRKNGGEHSFTNVVLACQKCNQRKGDLTPEQAGLKLQITPRIPSPIHVFAPNESIPTAWEPYFFKG